MTYMKIKVHTLLPGDYVVPAKATVLEIQSFAGVTIIDFTDKTATAPIPSHAMVEVYRPTTMEEDISNNPNHEQFTQRNQ